MYYIECNDVNKQTKSPVTTHQTTSKKGSNSLAALALPNNHPFHPSIMPTIYSIEPTAIASVQLKRVPSRLMTEIDPELPSAPENMIRLMVLIEGAECLLIDLLTNNGGYRWMQQLINQNFPGTLSFETWEVKDCPF